jgi:hypothetical protein
LPFQLNPDTSLDASSLAGSAAVADGAALRPEKDRVMAAHGTSEYAVADGNDYAAHEQTYLNFLSLVKWVLGSIIILLILMAYFLV